MSGGVPGAAQFASIQGAKLNNWITKGVVGSAGVEFTMSNKPRVKAFNGGSPVLSQVGVWAGHAAHAVMAPEQAYAWVREGLGDVVRGVKQWLCTCGCGLGGLGACDLWGSGCWAG